MSIDHMATESNTPLKTQSQHALNQNTGQFEWSVFWCRPWTRLHSSWSSVLDRTLIEDSIAEAMHYDDILDTLNIEFCPEPDIPNPLSRALATAAPELESKVFSYIAAILTDGHVAGELTEDERIWCYRFSVGLNLHQYGDAHRNRIISILQDDSQHPISVLSALLIRSWSNNDSGFWSRYRVRFNKDINLPADNLVVSSAKLNYIIKTAFYMAEQAQPIAKQIPEQPQRTQNEDEAIGNAPADLVS